MMPGAITAVHTPAEALRTSTPPASH
jgi:hypothetical protein